MYTIGKTLVEVYLPNKQDHEGVVVQETTTHVRVFQPDGPNRDVCQASSELFAKNFCVVVGELNNAIRIEPQLM